MGKIIIYDDEQDIVKKLKAGIRKVDLTPIVFTDLERLREYIRSDENWKDMQALIFDLAQAEEALSNDHKYAIVEDILYCYSTRRVPIFIHSAYAELVDVLQDLPGVFLHKKGGLSIRKLRKDLDIMKKSGFLDLFSEGSLLDDQVRIINRKLKKTDINEVKQLLHAEFINIFRDDEIMNNLESIIEHNDEPERICFERYFEPAKHRIME